MRQMVVVPTDQTKLNLIGKKQGVDSNHGQTKRTATCWLAYPTDCLPPYRMKIEGGQAIRMKSRLRSESLKRDGESLFHLPRAKTGKPLILREKN